MPFHHIRYVEQSNHDLTVFLTGNRTLVMRERLDNPDDVYLSVHCHNDLGLGVANSLSAIRAGATQIECTVNGIGERAGNTALEEVIMAMRTRPQIYPFSTRIDSTQIARASRTVYNIIGQSAPLNKPIGR